MAKHLAVERPYESLFICPVDTPQKTLDDFTDKIKTTLTETKATIRCFPIEGQSDIAGRRCFYSGRPATHMAIFARAY